MTDAARPAGLLIDGVEFVPQDIVEQHTPFLTPPGAQVEVLYRLRAGYHVVGPEDEERLIEQAAQSLYAAAIRGESKGGFTAEGAARTVVGALLRGDETVT